MNRSMEFPCRIVRWIDGDTCRADIDLGFNMWILNREIRLYGLSTPERRTKDKTEKAMGIHVAKLCEVMYPAGSEMTLLSYHQETGKYGRVLGDLYFGKRKGNQTWSDLIKRTGLFRFYDDDDPPSWSQVFDNYGLVNSITLSETGDD